MPVLHRWFNAPFWILFFVLFQLNGNAQIKKRFIKRYSHLLDNEAVILEIGRQKSVEKKGDTLIVKFIHPENRKLISTYSSIPNHEDSLVRTGYYRKWFVTGELAIQSHYENGELDGEWMRVNPFTFNISEKGVYSKGQKEGKWFQFHENGICSVENFYDYGKLIGTQSFFDDEGGLAFQELYDDGKFVKRNIFDTLGYRRTKEHFLPIFGDCSGLGGDAGTICSEENLMNYLKRKVYYPAESINFKDHGTVEVTFVINRNGEIEDPAILFGVSYHLDRTALWLVSMMPRWKPGTLLGKKEKVRYDLSINFRLN